MSKVECTAVNELVDLARSKPLDSDDDDADLFGGFGSNPSPAARLRGTPAPSLFEMPAPPPPAPVMQPVPQPVAQPVAQPQQAPQPQRVQPQPQRSAAARSTAMPRQAPMYLDHDDSATSHVARYVPLSTLGRRFGLPIAGLVGLGILTGVAYTKLAHHSTPAAANAPTPASVVLAAQAAAAAPAPLAPAAAAAVVEPIAPKLVDVRLESTPAGASATLISDGVSTPLGTTPVDASVDPAKQYDVVFALDGKPSQVQHFDPSKTQRVAAAFADAPPAEPVAAAATPAKPSHHHGKHAQAARVATATPAPTHSSKAKSSKMPSLAMPDFGDSSPAPKAPAGNPAAAGEGNGLLAISTSAPAAILLDDQNTGFTTPHTLTVPAGHHNIRLIAATAHVNKLVSVDVAVHKTTRINPF